MSSKWKKSFRKVPGKILIKLKSLKSDNIVVACVKKIPLNDIKSEMYKHLGLTMKDGKVHYEETIVPNPQTGRFSRYNLHGRVITLKDLPMIEKSYSADAPNFGDWSKGSHEITWDRKVYQKKYVLPKEISIKIELLTQAENNYTFKFSLDTFLSKKQDDLLDELLFHCCLLQENTGLCDIFEANASNEDYIKTLYVGWELLPPGIRDSEIINRILKTSKGHSPEIESTIKERLSFFRSLKIKNKIVGINRFNRYFGAKLENGYVILENVRYGNAIYVFKKNWEEFSKLSRIELQHLNSDDIVRIPHTNNWKNNVKQAIDEIS